MKIHNAGMIDPKMHLTVDAHGMPVRVIVTMVATADYTQTVALIDEIAAQYLPDDRGYDSNELMDKVIEFGCVIVILPSRNRSEQLVYDNYIYGIRHLV